MACDISAGDWVALMQNTNGLPNSVTLRWYQVSAADELDSESDIDRELSLSGPDWTPSSLPGAGPVYLVYMRNIEAVYEKTVELDLN